MNETSKHEGSASTKLPPLTAEELEAKFDAGEDISEYVDWESGVWVKPGEPTPGQKRAMEMDAASLESVYSGANRTEGMFVQVALPAWAYDQLTIEAKQQGVSQEDLAQRFIVQQLEQEKVSS